MPYRKFAFRAGHYYHLYNRGNNRQDIFFEKENYRYFLRLLKKYLIPHTADLVAYCLMPNHYHLLLHLKTDTLHKQMGPMLLAYTKAINKRFNRSGALFQGRFKGVWVDSDAYILELSRYIHRNPVQAGLVVHPQDWEFSSYGEYIGLRKLRLVSPEVVLGQFGTIETYQAFVEENQDQNILAHLLMD